MFCTLFSPWKVNAKMETIARKLCYLTITWMQRHLSFHSSNSCPTTVLSCVGWRMENCVSYKLTHHEANKLKWQSILRDGRTSILPYTQHGIKYIPQLLIKPANISTLCNMKTHRSVGKYQHFKKAWYLHLQHSPWQWTPKCWHLPTKLYSVILQQIPRCKSSDNCCGNFKPIKAWGEGHPCYLQVIDS